MRLKKTLPYNVASNCILVNDGDYLEHKFIIAANGSANPISSKDEDLYCPLLFQIAKKHPLV